MSWIINSLRHLYTQEHIRSTEREIVEELRFHIEMRTRDNLAAGMSGEEAKADALRRFGDFDCVKETCREICRQKQENRTHLRFIRGFIWAMLGVGLTLQITNDNEHVQQVGQILVWIALLWRLLLYLRSIRPIERHAAAGDQETLSVVGSPGAPDSDIPTPVRISVYDQRGRTPVERLLAEEHED